MQSNLPTLRTPKFNHNFDMTFPFHDNRSRVLMNAHQITYYCVNACIGTLTFMMFHQGPCCQVDISILKQITLYILCWKWFKYDKLCVKNVERKLDPNITQVTFISIHPRVTSVWTGSGHVITLYTTTTVTTMYTYPSRMCKHYIL